MNQTFYIDVDEEISSVIDRLRKSVSTDNYFVVPKRALFVQSIINLKLLKREGEKLQKRVILVMTDEFGLNMADKAGVEVQTSMEGVENASPSNRPQIQNPPAIEPAPALQPDDPAEAAADEKKEGSLRLRALGSDDYYGGEKKEDPLIIAASKGPQVSNIPVYNAGDPRRVPPIAMATVAKTATPVGQTVTPLRTAGPIRKSISDDITAPPRQLPPRLPSETKPASAYEKSLDADKEKTLEKMFGERQPAASAPGLPRPQEKISPAVGGRGRKVILAFIILCAIAFVSVAAYVFVPGATVEVVLDTQKKVVSTQLAAFGETKTETEEVMISLPLRLVKKEDSVSLTQESTGSAASATNKKAQGSVVIYNAFDGSPQTLVATTRIQTSDGKIFRLVKTVTVPGMSGSGSETKPGAIEAAVVADQPGDDYNIEPTTFTIPGFADGPKFEKFSAKSTQAMTGGTGDSKGPRAISEKDLADAKIKAEDALKEKLKADLASEVSKNELVLDGAQKIEIGSSAASGKAGSVSDTFGFTASGTLTALVFSGAEAGKAAEGIVGKKLDLQKYKSPEIKDLIYSNVVADFEAQKLNANVDVQLTLTPKFEAEKFKNDVAGKDENQIKQVVNQTFGIKNVNIEFFPSFPPFTSSLPKFTQRITVEVNAGE